MKLAGWGQYPIIDAELSSPGNEQQIKDLVAQADTLIPRGLGRSYGDSALAPQVLSCLDYDYFIGFDAETGLLTCAAGVTLAQILETFVPRGWFLGVTPGTKFVTVAGAIACDVHGKNHHVDGCFSEFVDSFKLLTGDQQILECSREQHADLFHASCGGMGLTGVIIEARIRLKPISSAMIDETTIKTPNLEQTLEQFEINQGTSYSVAWIDCLASGSALGRSLIMLGEHAQRGDLTTHREGRLTVPFNLPGMLLNSYSITAFNMLYYNRVRKARMERVIHYDPFFYPLDSINHWNRIYGKRGFVQYQFVIPQEDGKAGMKSILKAIADSRKGSFLAVLKAMGKANDNLLSFPMAGYTLALDFKMEDGLDRFLRRLDDMVLEMGGRVYLAKDALLEEKVFQQMYPQWQDFAELRQRYAADTKFNSLQSKRLGL